MMKKLCFGLALCSLLFACSKEDATLSVTNKSIAGTWVVEKYVEKVVRADGTSETGEFTEEVDPSYAYIFYSDGTGFERLSENEFYRVRYTTGSNRLTVTYLDAESGGDALEFVVKGLTDSKMTLETSESEAGETFTASATFRKAHPGIISFSDLVGKWAVGSENQIWEIHKDGTCKESVSFMALSYTIDYTIKLDAHKLILSASGNTVIYEVLCFGKDDIQIMSEKGNKPTPLIRMKD